MVPLGAEVLMAPPNRPHCTPAFTISDRSDIASNSIRDRRSDVAGAAVALPEAVLGGAARGEDLDLFADLRARDDNVGV